MKSKLILLFAIIIFIGLTLLLSMVIEKSKTQPKEKSNKKNTSEKINPETENEKTTSGALESMQWMTQVRAYPETDIPSDKFYKAFEYSKENLQTVNNRDDLDQWNSIGPDR